MLGTLTTAVAAGGFRLQFDNPEDCALSFYFQPQTPQNKSHRGETILVKDLVQQAIERNDPELAALPEQIRGYEQIKEAAIARVKRSTGAIDPSRRSKSACPPATP